MPLGNGQNKLLDISLGILFAFPCIFPPVVPGVLPQFWALLGARLRGVKGPLSSKNLLSQTLGQKYLPKSGKESHRYSWIF